MKFKTNERGFVLAEFAIALPLLILLLYSLGLVTLSGLKIAREQVADYVLETEAQYVIDRITADARAAQSVEIKNVNNFDEIIFYCNTISTEQEGNDFIVKDGKYYKYRDVEENKSIMYHNLGYYKNILEPRIYRVDSRDDGFFHIYFKHRDNTDHNNPLTGDNSYGDTVIRQFAFTKDEAKQILHITLEMESRVTEQKVKFDTSVYMPSYGK